MTVSPEIIIAAVAALVAAIGVLFRMVIKNFVDQIVDLRTENASLRSIANANLFAAEAAASRYSAVLGVTPVPKLAPVVSESNSPPTEKQLITADLATLRARTVAARLALELPPIEMELPEKKKESWLTRMLPPWK